MRAAGSEARGPWDPAGVGTVSASVRAVSPAGQGERSVARPRRRGGACAQFDGWATARWIAPRPDGWLPVVGIAGRARGGDRVMTADEAAWGPGERPGSRARRAPHHAQPSRAKREAGERARAAEDAITAPPRVALELGRGPMPRVNPADPIAVTLRPRRGLREPVLAAAPGTVLPHRRVRS